MNNLSKLFIKLGKLVRSAKVDSGIKSEAGAAAVDRIVKRTKRGFGVKGGKETKLAPLKRSTIERRKRAQLASDTSPSKSNLTETGKMLDSVTYKTNSSGFTILVDDDQEKVDGVVKKRPFLGLTEKDEQEIAEVLDQAILKALAKL